MNKQEMLGMVEQARRMQELLNAHELDEGDRSGGRLAVQMFRSDGDRGAWGCCHVLIVRLLTELYGTRERAEQFTSLMYDCGEDTAYCVQVLRDCHHATADAFVSDVRDWYSAGAQPEAEPVLSDYLILY